MRLTTVQDVRQGVFSKHTFSRPAVIGGNNNYIFVKGESGWMPLSYSGYYTSTTIAVRSDSEEASCALAIAMRAGVLD